ncbi:MAG: hypothetical protein ABIP39_04020 [Polyangiaceae bacterium]
MRHLKFVFALLAFGFFAAASFHAVAIFAPSIGPPSPTWRHALFVLVNVSVALGMLTRPRWFTPLFGLLCVQQLVSHGLFSWDVWQAEHRIDWGSVVVFVFMPATLVLLLRRDPAAR